jgi:hypothetical protein
MIDDHQLRRLAAADPASELDPAPREDLLARLVAQPRRRARKTRARSPRRLPKPAIALAAVMAVAGVAVLVDPPAPQALDLAAKAYAQTTAAADQIVHTVATTERTETTSAGRTRETGSLEEWHRGKETHRLEKYSTGGTPVALDHLIDADGVMRQVSEDGSYRVVRNSDDPRWPACAAPCGDSANATAQQQAGFVEDFRRRYERGELDRAGDLQFAGRPARRYLVSAEDVNPGGRPLPGLEQAFYIDRETGAPLGYTSTTKMKIRDLDGGSTPTTMRFVQTVRTIERLDPTPENLKKLRTFSLARK